MGNLQLNQATYLARLRAQMEWEREGAGLDGEGVEAGAGTPAVGVGTWSKGSTGQFCNKDSAGQVRASQPSCPSLQGSIYQVSIFLPVYW